MPKKQEKKEYERKLELRLELRPEMRPEQKMQQKQIQYLQLKIAPLQILNKHSLSLLEKVIQGQNVDELLPKIKALSDRQYKAFMQAVEQINVANIAKQKNCPVKEIRTVYRMVFGDEQIQETS